MENNLKGKFVKITPADMGITEDEWNNFLIDCWDCMNMRVKGDQKKPQYQYVDAATGEVLVTDKPMTVTITLKSQK